MIRFGQIQIESIKLVKNFLAGILVSMNPIGALSDNAKISLYVGPFLFSWISFLALSIVVGPCLANQLHVLYPSFHS